MLPRRAFEVRFARLRIIPERRAAPGRDARGAHL